MSRGIIRESTGAYGTEAPERALPDAHRPDPPRWVVPALIVTGVFVALLGYGVFASRQKTQALADALEDRTRQLQVYEQEPSCDGGADLTQELRDLVAAGSLDLAAGLAESELVDRGMPLCPETREALIQLWYGARMDLLLSTPRPSWPDSAFDQTLVARWLEIERKAEAYPLPAHQRWAPMTVATRAYSAGLWALADAGFRRAWSADETGEAPIAFRYALLRNWGHHLARDGGPAMDERARRLLATACVIADTVSLPDDQARRDLETFFAISDCYAADPDLADPGLTDPEQS